MKFDILRGFIDTEIRGANTPEHQEMYNEIRCFLTSYNIREGKYEGNEYLINKLSRDTVIIYQEYDTPEGWIYSQDARVCDIKKLIEEIDKAAKKEGLNVVS